MIKFCDCDYCKHSKGLKNGHIFCDAFPNGVPYSFYGKDLKKISDCNNGIGFEPKEKTNNN